MSWMSDYKNKLCSAEEAVSIIKSGYRLALSGNAATPYALLRALAKRDDLEGVELAHVLMLGKDPLEESDMGKRFRHQSFFVGPADRKSVNEGKADYIPIHLHQIPRLIKSGSFPIDVALLSLSPPDEHGFFSLGVEVMANKASVEVARHVVVEVNHRMPRVLGDSFIHISKIHKIAEVDEPLPELESGGFTDVEKKIGEYIAELIPDGATLQLGIGGIPNAVLTALEGKRDIGIHTEMISDGIMNAVESGMVTGAKKTLHPGKVISTFILGTKNLYDFVHDNPLFEQHPCDHTNDPFVIAQNENLIAINSALEVDLTGQVCADSIGTRIYSGFGGQLDFMRGALASKGGKPILAMPATAQGGKCSRIVPLLKEGAGVVTTRADVHTLVTEYGVAALYGKNLKQRAEALISISAPNFREELEMAAKKRRLL